MKDDLENRADNPAVVIAPTSYRLVGPDAFHPDALDVVDRNSDAIGQFLTYQRDQVRLGGLNVHGARYESPEIDVHYQRTQGQEIVSFEPRVAPRQPEEERRSPPVLHQVPEYLADEEDPDNPQFDTCMMVLYKGSKVAAFPMVQLEHPTKLAPIYVASIGKAQFSQPVITGQIVSAGVSFIQTDVDLSGKLKRNGKTSTFCTTQLSDAVDLGRQVTPILAGARPASDTLQAGDMLTIYTSIGSCKLDDKGKLTIGQKLKAMEQCCAIDSDGTYYFGPSYKTQECSLYMGGTSVHTDDVKDAVQKDQDDVKTWVMPYALNYIRYTDGTGLHHYTNNPTLYVYDTNVYDPIAQKELYGSLILQNQTTVDSSEGPERLVIFSTPIPNANETTKGHVGYTNITEFIGENYYATMKVDDAKMKAQGIKHAYDNVYYYSWVYDTNFYEYVSEPRFMPKQSTDFSGAFPRMIYDQSSKDIALFKDKVTATASQTYTLDLFMIQPFPEWGGMLIDGVTTTEETSYLPPDLGGGVASDVARTQQMVAHSTVAPTGKDFAAAVLAETHGTYSYAVGAAAVANILQELAAGVPGFPNGPGGEDGGFSSTMETNRYYETAKLDIYDNRYDAYDAHTEHTGPTTTGHGVTKPPPGYKSQLIGNVLDIKIDWIIPDVVGYDSIKYVPGTLHLQDTSADYKHTEVECLPFPYGSDKKVFAKIVKQRKRKTNPSYSYITPYMTTDENNPTSTQPTLKGWLQLTNLKHLLQGWTVTVAGTTKAYIYIDGVDVMQTLTSVLKCDPTDIAACYFDIDLARIKQLANVS